MALDGVARWTGSPQWLKVMAATALVVPGPRPEKLTGRWEPAATLSSAGPVLAFEESAVVRPVRTMTCRPLARAVDSDSGPVSEIWSTAAPMVIDETIWENDDAEFEMTIHRPAYLGADAVGTRRYVSSPLASPLK